MSIKEIVIILAAVAFGYFLAKGNYLAKILPGAAAS